MNKITNKKTHRYVDKLEIVQPKAETMPQLMIRKVFILQFMTQLILQQSSSSSYCATSTNIPDPLSLLLPIVHHF